MTKTREAVDPGTGEVFDAGNLPATMSAGIGQSLAVQLAMAEHNQDVISAKTFPRSVAVVMRNVTELVMLDEATARECVYAVPRDGKTIRGPSIRLAEIIASQWGNCHCASRVVHVDRIEKYVESEGIFHDLETGLRRTARTRKSISKRDGGIYSQDMIMTAGNAAASIAMRESILKGVPKAVWRQAYDHAEKVIKGDITTLAERRGNTLKTLANIGVTPDMVFAAIGVAGVEDIGVDELADLYAMYQGIKNGDTNVDDVFPPVKAKQDKAKDLGSQLDRLATGGEKPATDKQDQKSDAGASPAVTGEAEKQDAPPKSTAAAQKTPPSGTASDGGAQQDSAQTRNHAPETTSADAASDPSPSSESDAATSDENETPYKKASREGRAAYRKDLSRKANPYKLDKILSEGWLEGYDDEEKIDQANSAGS